MLAAARHMELHMYRNPAWSAASPSRDLTGPETAQDQLKKINHVFLTGTEFSEIQKNPTSFRQRKVTYPQQWH